MKHKLLSGAVLGALIILPSTASASVLDGNRGTICLSSTH